MMPQLSVLLQYNSFKVWAMLSMFQSVHFTVTAQAARC